MNLPVFSRDKQCTLCALSTGVKSPCIATRPADRTVPGSHDTALFVVGDHPGVLEDRADCGFVAQKLQIGRQEVPTAGLLLHAVYLKLFDLRDKCDVYVTNAVRCLPPKAHAPSKGELTACRSYLDADLRELSRGYKRVVILACGTSACQSLFGATLSETLQQQPKHVLVDGISYTAFATNNPAIGARDPAKLHSVREHLRMLAEYLDTGELRQSLVVPEIERGVLVCETAGVLAFDLETYGAVEGLPRQTTFQPQKMILLDGVACGDIIQTAALAWRALDGRLRTSVYLWSNGTERAAFFASLGYAIRDGAMLSGKNVLYDVSVLRWCEPLACEYLNKRYFAQHEARLWDVSIRNFQHSNVRPERGLKAESTLLGTYDYSGELNLRSGDRYSGADDPRLWHYNCVDACTTLLNDEEWVARIRSDYPQSERLSELAVNFYSDLLWTVLHMEEEGLEFDRCKLSALAEKCRRRMMRAARHYTQATGHPLGGEGSQGPIRRLFLDGAIEAGLYGDSVTERDPRLESTKTVPVSANANNRILILADLPKRSPLRFPLAMTEHYSRSQKILTSYAESLLYGKLVQGPQEAKPATGCKFKFVAFRPRKADVAGAAPDFYYNSKAYRVDYKHGTEAAPAMPEVRNAEDALVQSRAYYRFYIVPSLWHEDSNQSGGTQQARLASASQTLPYIVKKCLASRHAHGFVLEADYSGLEYWIAGWLFNEPVILREMEQKLDPHRETAIVCYGPAVVNEPKFKSYHRQAAKIANYGSYLYRGSWKVLVRAARLKCRIEIPEQEARRIVDAGRRKLSALYAAQDELLAHVRATGYLELPYGLGDARLYIKGRFFDEADYVSTVCNQPVQTVAARLLESAHRAILDEAEERGLVTCFPQQTHDSVWADGPASEYATVKELIARHMRQPPLLPIIERRIARKISLDCEFKLLATSGGFSPC